jgi:hypothetical protein
VKHKETYLSCGAAPQLGQCIWKHTNIPLFHVCGTHCQNNSAVEIKEIDKCWPDHDWMRLLDSARSQINSRLPGSRNRQRDG